MTPLAQSVGDLEPVAAAIQAARRVGLDGCDMGYVTRVERERDEARADVERLRAAIEEFRLWDPKRAGYAAAHRRLMAAAQGGDGLGEQVAAMNVELLRVEAESCGCARRCSGSRANDPHAGGGGAWCVEQARAALEGGEQHG